jgi:hypothetical protein
VARDRVDLLKQHSARSRKWRFLNAWWCDKEVVSTRVKFRARCWSDAIPAAVNPSAQSGHSAAGKQALQ